MSEAAADTAAVEETTEALAETTETEGTQQQEQQEEVIYAGKYKTPEDLEKGYNELYGTYTSRLKGFTGAPESGEYEVKAAEGIEQADLDFIMETPMFTRLKERGLEQGMNNDMFNGIINDYVTIQREENQAFIQAEKQKLGDDADKRITNLIDRLGTKFEGERLEAVKNSLITAEVIEAWEQAFDEHTNTVAPADTDVTSADTEQELQDLWNAKDESGRRKMEYDRDYRDMVQKKWKAYYGD